MISATPELDKTGKPQGFQLFKGVYVKTPLLIGGAIALYFLAKKLKFIR